MKTTTQAIEAVSDRRHSRLCQHMPEHVAARHIVDYLAHLQAVHKLNPHVLGFIVALLSGYSAKI